MLSLVSILYCKLVVAVYHKQLNIDFGKRKYERHYEILMFFFFCQQNLPINEETSI